MNRTALRVRGELEQATGIDFAGYADPELVDALTGWTGALGVVRDLAVSLAAVLAVGIVAMVAAWQLVTGFDPRAGVVIGGIVAGLGVGAWVFTTRIRRRIPTEVERVIDLSGRLVDRVGDDMRTGRLSVGANQVAEGLALVAVVPALTRVTRRRIPVVGLVIAPLIGNLLTRILVAVWPRSGTGGAIGLGGGGAARMVDQALDSARSSIMPRLDRGVRWATLPLLAAGLILVLMGGTVAALSIISG